MLSLEEDLMKMAKLIMMIMVWTVYLSGFADGSPPSVTYMNSTRGDFFLHKGYAISPKNDLVVIPQTKICDCQNICMTDVWCATWSSHPSQGLQECRITNESPPEVQLEENLDAIYQFFPGSVDGKYTMEADGLLYLYPSARLNYTDAKAFCAAIPGHRLSIFKTMVQYEILLSYYANIHTAPFLLVDLDRNDEGEHVWADGIPHLNTEISNELIPKNSQGFPAYVFSNGNVFDADPVHNFRFLCQANPKGVPW